MPWMTSAAETARFCRRRGAMMRRVVVTGLGLLTPLSGCGVEATWKRLIEGKSGVRRVKKFDVSDLPLQDRRHHPARGRLGRHLQCRPLDVGPKEQHKVDDLPFSMPCARRDRRLTMLLLEVQLLRRPDDDGRPDRLRNRRRGRDCRNRDRT